MHKVRESIILFMALVLSSGCVFAEENGVIDTLAHKAATAYGDHRKNQIEAQFLSYIYKDRHCDLYKNRIVETAAKEDAWRASFVFKISMIHNEAQLNGCAKNTFAEKEMNKHKLSISGDARCVKYLDLLSAESKLYTSGGNGKYIVSVQKIKADAKIDRCLAP